MELFNWLPGIIGLGGFGVGVAAYLLGIPAALGILKSVLEIATPIFKGISEFVVWYVKNMWDGLGIILKNTSTFVVIATVAGSAAFYSQNSTKCQPTPKKIEKKVTKPVVKPTKTTDDWNPFGW